MFADHQCFLDIVNDRIFLIAYHLIDHMGQFYCVVNTKPSNENFGIEVFLTRFTVMVVAVLIPVSVQTTIIHVGRNIIVGIAEPCVHKQAAVGNNVIGTACGIGITTEEYIGDAFVLVIINDAISDLFLLVNTCIIGIDVFNGNDFNKIAFGVFVLNIRCKSIKKRGFGDDEHISLCIFIVFIKNVIVDGFRIIGNLF